MKPKTRILQTIESIFSDYPDDFDIDIEQKPLSSDGWCYFSVIIRHNRLGNDNEFSVRANYEDIEMDYHEDSWCDLDKGNLLFFMWFNEAKERHEHIA